MNRQFDIIIIGDSKDGYATMKQLAGTNKALKIAFISKEFKRHTTRDFLNVEYIKDEVTFADYKNRLFGCYLKSGDRLFCTHLIIACGLKYAPLIANHRRVPCVYHNTDDIPRTAKLQPAVVFGSNEVDIKMALTVAKKYKQVYLCSSTFNLCCNPATLKKIEQATNLVVLPNANLLRITADAAGNLKTVELDNYATLTCSAIYVKTASVPDTAWLSTKLIKKNAEAYLETTKNLESTLVPKCYAVGSCAVKSTKKMQQAMILNILADFEEDTIC